MFVISKQIHIDCFLDNTRKIEEAVDAWNIPVCYNQDDVKGLSAALDRTIELPQFIYVSNDERSKEQYLFLAHFSEDTITLGRAQTPNESNVAIALHPDFTKGLHYWWDENKIRELKEKSDNN